MNIPASDKQTDNRHVAVREQIESTDKGSSDSGFVLLYLKICGPYRSPELAHST